MVVRLLLALLLGALLAGCAGDDGSTDLAFSGEGRLDLEQQHACAAQGRLEVAAVLEAGMLNVKVFDGEGQQLWMVHAEAGPTAQEHVLTGVPGTWTVHAYNTDDFEGTFSARLDCR